MQTLIVKFLQWIKHYSNIFTVIITSLTLWWNKDLANFVLNGTEQQFDVIDVENVNGSLYINYNSLKNEPKDTYIRKTAYHSNDNVIIYIDSKKGCIYISRANDPIASKSEPMKFKTPQEHLDFLQTCPLSETAQNYDFENIPKWPHIQPRFDPKTITLDAETDRRPRNLPYDVEMVRVMGNLYIFQK